MAAGLISRSKETEGTGTVIATGIVTVMDIAAITTGMGKVK